MLKRLISKFKITKNKFIWLLVFLLSATFFFMSAPVNVSAQDEGFAPNLVEAIDCMISGCVRTGRESAGDVYLYQPGAFNPDGSSVGAIQQVSALSDELYKQPSVSGVVWAIDQYQQLYDREFLAVYAQSPSESDFYFPGLGYNLLRPVLTLWQWSRNLVYAFFVIIIIVIAFLILFRQSLGGQAVVTIVNSLPSIIISLLLVTLSYPICGFFVDLIYIGTNLAQSTLITSPGAPGNVFVNSQTLEITPPEGTPRQNDINYLQPDDPEISIWAIWGLSSTEIANCDVDRDGNPDTTECTSNLLPDIPENSAGLIKYVGRVLPLVEQVADSTLQLSGNNLLNLVLSLAAFSASFKLFLGLLKNYVTLTLSPLLAPWVFLTAALPSRTKGAIVSFFSTLAASSLSFIVIYILFLLMVIIGNGDAIGTGNIGQFNLAPPLLGYSHDQIMVDQDVIRPLIIYSMFLFAPSVPDLLKNLLNVQSSSQVASQIGQSTARAGATTFAVGGAILKNLGIGGGGGGGGQQQRR